MRVSSGSFSRPRVTSSRETKTFAFLDDQFLLLSANQKRDMKGFGSPPVWIVPHRVIIHHDIDDAIPHVTLEKFRNVTESVLSSVASLPPCQDS